MRTFISQIVVMLVLTLALNTNLQSQSVVRKFDKFEDSGNKIKIFVSDGIYEIVPYSNKILHTTFFPKGKQLKDFSFAVKSEPIKAAYTVSDKGNFLTIDLNDLKVIISKSPFKISYFDNKNKLLISEYNGYSESKNTMSNDFAITKDEIFYGGGARALGMNRRGNKLKLYNEPHYGYENRADVLNYSLPVFISSKKYAVLFDNPSLGYLDLDSKKNNQITYETSSGLMNYYVIIGTDWYDLTYQYTALTGRQPLPPRWAFGNFSSRFGYHSQKETEQTVDRFFKDTIPLDAVVIDIYWFGKEIKGTLGNLEWDTDSFPDPDKMIKSFKARGIKTILVTEPFILNTSKKWNEAVEKNILCTDSSGQANVFNFYFGNTGLIDLFKPEAREWFWNVYKKYTSQGIDGWWGDLGEPENHPSHVIHSIGSADEVHNAYGHEWVKLIYEGYQKDFPNQRPFILMRAGFAGSQRYGIIPWTGDVSRSWGGLAPQPEISLQMGIQGIAYMHSDLGGYSEVKNYDSELYTRWLQYGVFQPIYRPHAFEAIPSEPVFHENKIKALARKSIELRYRLLPYNYNMAFENSQTGKPLMIPLFYIEPGNPVLLNYDKAYMWGDAFLVSPVKEKGKMSQNIYFPKGSNWYDFFGNSKYPGGNSQNILLKTDHIPVFVKGGSFIPMSIKAENTMNYSLKEFELHFFADPLVTKSKYRLYNDDGKTPDALAKGQYEMFDFDAFNQAKSLQIQLIKSKAGESFAGTQNKVTLSVHNLNKKPVEIKINDQKLEDSEWEWNNEKKLLHLSIFCTTDQGKIEIFK